ncbi:hypothetical protein E4U43_007019 [Claviceps pusilla]|uniref:DCG1 protein n=1 Tax=Claviceps pusilla TaxID=123648 RepID=A0A9P7T204_9HYPO|nr:hypothetical protein E4U43_007019 [Claviceps pusilla]
MESMEIVPMTALLAPPSIDNDHDIQASTNDVLACLATRPGLFTGYDAILVACFSVHALVPALSGRLPGVPVTGIFEAGVLAALSLLGPSEKWGIVTTGEFWERHLGEGVDAFLGIRGRGRGRGCGAAAAAGVEHTKFAGVFSSGLTAGDFHTVSASEVREKLGAAARRLLASGEVGCVVMGCGGMAGLEDIIRSAAVEVYDESRAKSLYIVDGVRAGILQLHQTVHGRRMFR